MHSQNVLIGWVKEQILEQEALENGMNSHDRERQSSSWEVKD
jgi:hypothetical protein